MLRRFQFSLRNLLWAMFWLSVCGAAFSGLRVYDDLHLHGPRWLRHSFFWCLLILFISSPFTAIGALFGRTRIGMLVGGLAVLAFWLSLPYWVTG